ncbi:hypothetical protein E4T56_gene5997 [Termitomyces sp. T112]|nr:hypothetical protein E4T56_gene5997 [Termitomyces sp. T112]
MFWAIPRGEYLCTGAIALLPHIPYTHPSMGLTVSTPDPGPLPAACIEKSQSGQKPDLEVLSPGLYNPINLLKSILVCRYIPHTWGQLPLCQINFSYRPTQTEHSAFCPPQGEVQLRIVQQSMTMLRPPLISRTENSSPSPGSSISKSG